MSNQIDYAAIARRLEERKLKSQRTKEQNHAYYAANSERLKAQRHARYRENPKKYNASAKAWRKANANHQREYSRGWRERNRERSNEYMRNYQRDWARRNTDRTRGYRLKHIYGLTQEEYDKLVGDQAGICLICELPPGKRGLVVDHDHDTQEVRGLLCWHCNSLLGQAGDSSSRLEAAAAYLRRYGR